MPHIFRLFGVNCEDSQTASASGPRIPSVSERQINPSWVRPRECQASLMPVPMPIHSWSLRQSSQPQSDYYKGLIPIRNQLILRACVNSACMQQGTMQGPFDHIWPFTDSLRGFKTVNKYLTCLMVWWYIIILRTTFNLNNIFANSTDINEYMFVFLLFIFYFLWIRYYIIIIILWMCRFFSLFYLQDLHFIINILTY